MKKNNKFRSNNNYNNNNQIFSLNYKFDSISPAGKVSGTALDLIKRYNELAKEAQGNGDHVAAEMFRQYAEHYRKIVTEINERKNLRQANREENAQAAPAETAQATENETVASSETQAVAETPKPEAAAPVVEGQQAQEAPVARKRSFKVIEINAADAEKPVSQVSRPRGRAPRKPRVEVAAL